MRRPRLLFATALVAAGALLSAGWEGAGKAAHAGGADAPPALATMLATMPGGAQLSLPLIGDAAVAAQAEMLARARMDDLVAPSSGESVDADPVVFLGVDGIVPGGSGNLSVAADHEVEGVEAIEGIGDSGGGFGHDYGAPPDTFDERDLGGGGSDLSGADRTRPGPAEGGGPGPGGHALRVAFGDDGEFDDGDHAEAFCFVGGQVGLHAGLHAAEDDTEAHGGSGSDEISEVGS